MSFDSESLKSLREIPAFVDFSCAKMDADAEFWKREAAHGTGIMRTLAVGIVAIGGGEDGKL